MTRPAQKAIEAAEPLTACDSCGRNEEGLPMSEHTDEGDPSVGYGPNTLVYCDGCWEQMTGTRQASSFTKAE